MAELSSIVTLTTISSDRANLWQDRMVQRYSSVANRTSLHPGPTEGDLSYLTDSNTVWVYDGSAWVVVGPLPDNTVTTVKLVDNAVVTAKIADANVTTAKLAASVAQNLMRAGGAMNTTNSVLTASFVDRASVSFTKPSTWGSYRISAQGVASFETPGAPKSGVVSARVEIGASNGTTASTALTSAQQSVSAFHTVDTSTSPVTVTIACLSTAAAGLPDHAHSSISYTAFQLT